VRGECQLYSDGWQSQGESANADPQTSETFATWSLLRDSNATSRRSRTSYRAGGG